METEDQYNATYLYHLMELEPKIEYTNHRTNRLKGGIIKCHYGMPKVSSQGLFLWVYRKYY